jgi:phosphosulfolactate phosphohydrolase-like enzyme
LLAAFSAGLRAALIKEKGLDDRGTSLEDAHIVAESLGCTLFLGGELNGKPVPGGIIGNSPLIAANCNSLKGNVLHFQSTNFARTFIDMFELISLCVNPIDIYVISFANINCTAATLKHGSYSRFFLACGGFYESLSLEDMALGGSLVAALSEPRETLDDESLAMFACYQYALLQPDILENTWTARVLHAISKGSDVLDILHPSRLPEPIMEKMSRIVLKVEIRRLF